MGGFRPQLVPQLTIAITTKARSIKYQRNKALMGVICNKLLLYKIKRFFLTWYDGQTVDGIFCLFQ